MQRAHIHVDPKWLALMFHFVDIIVISFCKLAHIHMFPKSLAFQENYTTLLFLAKLLKHPTNHHHPHPLIPPNLAFMSMRAHYLQMKKIIWSYIQIWMMYSSRCVLCPFHWEKNSDKLGMNDACVVFFGQSSWKRMCQSHQLRLSPSCFQVFANDYLLFKDLHNDPNFNILCTKVFGLQRVWICVASSQQKLSSCFLAFFCLLHFLMLNHKTEKK